MSSPHALLVTFGSFMPALNVMPITYARISRPLFLDSHCGAANESPASAAKELEAYDAGCK